MLPSWQTKLSHLDRWIRPQTAKTVHTTCVKSKTLKNKYQMSLTASWGILTLGKIARGMFYIVKSDYVVSCNSFSINREKLGDYLKWTDYNIFWIGFIYNNLSIMYFALSVLVQSCFWLWLGSISDKGSLPEIVL